MFNSVRLFLSSTHTHTHVRHTHTHTHNHRHPIIIIAAVQAAGVPLRNYTRIRHSVLAVGPAPPPGGQFEGQAMLQRGPNGLPLFLHAHNPKVSVPWALPAEPPAQPRQWQLVRPAELSVLPPGVPREAANTHRLLDAVAGFDVEAGVERLRAYMLCRPAWVRCCLSK